MLNDFRHCLYTDFVFGKDAEKGVGKELKRLGANTVLVHHDSGAFLYDTGLLENVKGYLQAEGLKVVELGGVHPNPRLSLVKEGIELAKKEGVDFILALGGGSTIDSSKAIGIGMRYDGDVWDLYDGTAGPESTVPVSVILTYPATGSESSAGSVISNDLVDPWTKTSCGRPFMRSVISFLNPELTYTLPPYLTACGVTDMYIHLIERYFAQDLHTYGIMDYMGEAAFRTLLDFGPKVLADPKNYEYRAEIMWIGTIAHNDTTGVGRVQDWASHGMGHEMGAMYDTAHGATLSIITPAWMQYVYQTDVKRFARYAREVFRIDEADDETAALKGIEATKAFFKSLNMPVSFKEANIPTDKFDVMAKQAVELKKNAGGLGKFKGLNVEDVIHIYRLAAE